MEKHTLYLMAQEDLAQALHDILEAHLNNEDKCKDYLAYIEQMNNVIQRLLDESEPSDHEVH